MVIMAAEKEVSTVMVDAVVAEAQFNARSVSSIATWLLLVTIGSILNIKLPIVEIMDSMEIVAIALTGLRIRIKTGIRIQIRIGIIPIGTHQNQNPASSQWLTLTLLLLHPAGRLRSILSCDQQFSEHSTKFTF